MRSFHQNKVRFFTIWLVLVLGVVWCGVGAVGATELPQVDDDRFQSAVLEASKERPVVVDFTASWCRPCERQAEVLVSAYEKHGDQVGFFQLDVDRNATDDTYSIPIMPRVTIFVDGEIFRQYQGIVLENVLEAGLENALKAVSAGDENS